MTVLAPRRIDHVVLAVRDIDAAIATFGHFGFNVSTRGQHPFGTGNATIQFSDTFLELVCVDDPTQILEGSAAHFSFGGFNRDFLRAHEGMSMLALSSDSAAADLDLFDSLGLWTYNPTGFERQATGPDGKVRPIAFSMAHVAYEPLEDIAFFTCEHHNRENFFFAERQDHENMSIGIDSVVIVAPDPADHHEFLTYVTGQHDIRSTGLGLSFALGDASIDVISPIAYRAFFNEDPEPMIGRLAAIRFAVSDPDAVLRMLQARSLRHFSVGDTIVAPSVHAHGAGLAFVPRHA